MGFGSFFKNAGNLVKGFFKGAGGVEKAFHKGQQIVGKVMDYKSALQEGRLGDVGRMAMQDAAQAAPAAFQRVRDQAVRLRDRAESFAPVVQERIGQLEGLAQSVGNKRIRDFAERSANKARRIAGQATAFSQMSHQFM